MGRDLLIVCSTLAILLLGAVRGEHSWGEHRRLGHSARILQDTVTRLEGEIEILETQMAQIKASPIYARKILRDKFHMTDERERILFFEE